MTTNHQPVDVALERIEAIAVWLERYSDNGQHRKINGPDAGRSFDVAQDLRALVKAFRVKLAEREAEVALLRSDAELVASCPWRVQKGSTALCQPPKNMREALDRAEAAERAREEACGLLNQCRYPLHYITNVIGGPEGRAADELDFDIAAFLAANVAKA